MEEFKVEVTFSLRVELIPEGFVKCSGMCFDLFGPLFQEAAVQSNALIQSE